MTIPIYGKYTNVHDASNAPSVPEPTPHGLTASAIDTLHERMSAMSPELSQSAAPSNRFRNLFDGDLPEGASWTPTRTGQLSGPGGGGNFGSPGGGGRTLITQQTPYQPEFASPDRQQYPVHRILANRYWRLFYKLDPVIGNCLDMYGELPWSNFELTGDGVEGEIRAAYEQQCRETQVLALLPYFVKEFMAVGECIPHTFFDNEKGIFTHIALHNPDQLEVIDAPFIKMEPILEFIPDDRLRSVLTSDQPSLRQLRERMPDELLTRLHARQNIPLSPVNATFIPRKLHPYDTRGTSILSRLWRVLMLEDAVFNATIQTARRHAAPLKVAKLGNAATGWIPPPEQEKRLLELLAQAEMDPNAWLVYHYGIQFDTIGTTDRVMSVNREWDVIERIKLVALGISKSFLHGEVSYASSATGLQVFLQRLKSLRMFFEQKWLYPKFFRPIAEINGWIKPKPSEVAHRYKVKRSARELQEQNAYIIPRIVWDKSLDPQINTSLIQAMTALEAMGIKFSKTSKMATVGYSYEEETKKIHREIEFEKTFLPKLDAPKTDGAPGGGGMMGGGDAPPPPGGDAGGDMEEGKAPPGADGVVPQGVTPPQAPPTPPGASKVEVKADDGPDSVADVKKSKSSIDSLKSEIWADDKYGNWEAKEVSDLLGLIQDLDTESAFWDQLGHNKDFKKAVIGHDMNMAWNLIDDYLQQQGYPDQDINELQEILEHEQVLIKSNSLDEFQRLEDALPNDAGQLSDDEFVAKIQDVLRNKNDKFTADSFLTGLDSQAGVSHLDGNLPVKNK